MRFWLGQNTDSICSHKPGKYTSSFQYCILLQNYGYVLLLPPKLNTCTLSWMVKIFSVFQSKYLHEAARKLQCMIFLTLNWLTFFIVLIDCQTMGKECGSNVSSRFFRGSVALQTMAAKETTHYMLLTQIIPSLFNFKASGSKIVTSWSPMQLKVEPWQPEFSWQSSVGNWSWSLLTFCPTKPAIKEIIYFSIKKIHAVRKNDSHKITHLILDIARLWSLLSTAFIMPKTTLLC